MSACAPSCAVSLWISVRSADARPDQYADESAEADGEPQARPPQSRAAAARATIIGFKFSGISIPRFWLARLGAGPGYSCVANQPHHFFFLSKVSIEGKQAVRYPDGEVFTASDLTIARRKHPEDLNLGTRNKPRPARQLPGGPFRRGQPFITFRTTLSPSDIATVTPPSSPTKGRYVPVFGKVDAICSSRCGAGWSATAKRPGAGRPGGLLVELQLLTRGASSIDGTKQSKTTSSLHGIFKAAAPTSFPSVCLLLGTVSIEGPRKRSYPNKGVFRGRSLVTARRKGRRT